MDQVSDVTKIEAITSFQSTIKKMEKALTQMTQKGSNTTLIAKRLRAMRIGLDMLEATWDQRPTTYSLDELRDARNIMNGLLPSIEDLYAKAKVGSSQKTLLERRIKSLILSIQAIDSL